MSSDTVSREVTIANCRGLHARASARFAREAGTFKSRIEVAKDGAAVIGTSIMGLMMLGAAKGETITVSAGGMDAEEAVNSLCSLVQNLFGEDE